MGKNGWLAVGCGVLAWLLSDLACWRVGYAYATLKYCQVCSAPASTAFWLCVPYGAGILICGVLAWTFWRRRGR